MTLLFFSISPTNLSTLGVKEVMARRKVGSSTKPFRYFVSISSVVLTEDIAENAASYKYVVEKWSKILITLCVISGVHIYPNLDYIYGFQIRVLMQRLTSVQNCIVYYW